QTDHSYLVLHVATISDRPLACGIWFFSIGLTQAGGLEGGSPPRISLSARGRRQSRRPRAAVDGCGEGCTFPTPLCVNPILFLYVVFSPRRAKNDIHRTKNPAFA